MRHEPKVADGGIPWTRYHAERRDAKLVDGAEREVENIGGKNKDGQVVHVREGGRWEMDHWVNHRIVEGAKMQRKDPRKCKVSAKSGRR